MLPYERFGAWRHCHNLALATYKLTRTFPAHERFGLTSQARRAAFSAAANIVEGSAKKGSREFRRFLDIALGSLSELRYIIHLATDLNYITAEERKEIVSLHEQASKTTWALYRSMNKSDRLSA